MLFAEVDQIQLDARQSVARSQGEGTPAISVATKRNTHGRNLKRFANIVDIVELGY